MMKNIGLLVSTSIRNNLRSKVALIVYIFVTIICILGVTISLCYFLISPEMDKPLPDRPKLELYLGLLMFATCFISLGVNLNSFAFMSITREKSKGVIESLLATPFRPNEIWIAKSLAVFLPGLILGEVLTFIVLLIINYIYFIPAVGFVFNTWIAVSSFICAPFIYLCLSLLVHFIGLTGKPAVGNVIVQVFLPVFLSLMINLTVRYILDITSWSFALANFGVVVLISLVFIFLKSRLNRERIVLSR
jgi:ABC-2 type transport system permease protein